MRIVIAIREILVAAGRPRPAVVALALWVGAWLGSPTARAEEWRVEWFTVDGGGGGGAGGGLAVTGTIGQADAGSLAGGAYAVVGGFWPVASDLGSAPPRLHIATTGANVTLSWTPGGAGFVLQASAGAMPSGWVDLPSGTGSPVTLRADGPWRFFRLRHP